MRSIAHRYENKMDNEGYVSGVFWSPGLLSRADLTMRFADLAFLLGVWEDSVSHKRLD
jgi:hypothetical protein